MTATAAYEDETCERDDAKDQRFANNYHILDIDDRVSQDLATQPTKACDRPGTFYFGIEPHLSAGNTIFGTIFGN